MNNNFLVKYRLEKEMSQQQVSEVVGIDRSYYTKIENGLVPSVKVAKLIANEFGFDWTLFFSDSCAKNAQNKIS